jgi:hypothetical protein
MLPSLPIVLTAVFTLACGVSSSPTSHLSKNYALKSTHHVPRKWSRIGSAPPGHIITLQIGLRQGRSDEILRHLNQGTATLFTPLSTHGISAFVIQALLAAYCFTGQDAQLPSTLSPLPPKHPS